ncbi:MAG: hypothetical protein GY755_11735 [Chloroflexi bacterium]|nr:hypothetical protein [Chloroflexota bacterium]
MMDDIRELKFEEYRTFVEDTARFTERRQNTSNIYISINSLLLSGLVFSIKDFDSNLSLGFLFPFLIVVAGIFISRLWKQIITKYKELVGLRIRTLREMENDPDLTWMTKMYHAEDTLYPVDKENQPIMGKGLNFSDQESKLRTIFIRLYIIAGIFLLASLFLNP